MVESIQNIINSFISRLTTQILSSVHSMWGVLDSSADLLLWSVVLLFFSLYLFLLQIGPASTYISTLRWDSQHNTTGNHGANRIPWLDFNKLFLVPLKLSQLLLFYYLLNFRGNTDTVRLYLDCQYVPITATEVSFGLQLDYISAGFLATTMFIGSLVNVFVPYYMKNEHGERRFFILLNMFLFSMLFLILASNFIVFFLFWELIGVFSFFLINFWSKKASTFKSAIKALVYNQISDAALLCGIAAYYNLFGTFEFPERGQMACWLLEGNSSGVTLTILPIFIAASCKSVQFCFHFWLPDSMDAPAPASALIHSATLVAAGVLLILRIKPALVLDTTIPTLFSYIALLTILVGGLAAAFQNDVKKILAYSTISNCGYMIFLAINSTNWATLLFFSTHGLLKAMSFIFIGILILIVHHRQGLTYFGNLAVTYNALLIGTTISVCTLGALPTTVMGTVKHKLFFYGAPILTDTLFTQTALILGGLTSLTYSYRLISTVFLEIRLKDKHIDVDSTPALSIYSFKNLLFGSAGTFNFVIVKALSSVTQVLFIIVLLFYVFSEKIHINLYNNLLDIFLISDTIAPYYEYASGSQTQNQLGQMGRYVNPWLIRFAGLYQMILIVLLAARRRRGLQQCTTLLTVLFVWCAVLYIIFT